MESIPNHTDKQLIVLSFGFALAQIGDFEKLLEVVNYGTVKWYSQYFKALVYSHRNETKKLQELIKNMIDDNYIDLTILVGWKNEIDGKTDLVKMIYETGLNYTNDNLIKSEFLYHLKYFDKAEEILENELPHIELPAKLRHMSYLAMSYAQNQKIAKAIHISENLEELISDCPSFKGYNYDLACIYAALNDKNSAIKWLKNLDYN